MVDLDKRDGVSGTHTLLGRLPANDLSGFQASNVRSRIRLIAAGQTGPRLLDVRYVPTPTRSTAIGATRRGPSRGTLPAASVDEGSPKLPRSDGISFNPTSPRCAGRVGASSSNLGRY
jgi:hypothetical protein